MAIVRLLIDNEMANCIVDPDDCFKGEASGDDEGDCQTTMMTLT